MDPKSTSIIKKKPIPALERIITKPITTYSSDQSELKYDCKYCFRSIIYKEQLFQTGHNYAQPNNDCCSICENRINSKRNAAIEKIKTCSVLQCTFKQNGCSELALSNEELYAHEKVCDYSPISCPINDRRCERNWKGTCKNILNHIISHHPYIFIMTSEKIVFLGSNVLKTRPLTNWIVLQSCYGCIFLVYLRKQLFNFGIQYYGFVLVLDNKTIANKYNYQMEIKNNDKKIVWESKTRSVQENIQSIMKEKSCLIMDEGTVQNFVYNDDLQIVVSIKPADMVDDD